MTAQAVTKQETALPMEQPQPVSDTMAMMQVIERAARDPSVDVSKMRELMAMRKELVAEQASQEWDEAMAAAQAEIRPIAADASNPQTKSKYASYLALDRALRPIFAKHGFNLAFNTADGAATEYVRCICDVSRKGHTRRFQVDLPADGKGAKGGDVMTKTHAAGAALTYGQRYLLKMIGNIAIGADDDGNAAGAGEPVTPEQLQEIINLCDEVGADKEKFCEHLKVESLAAIPKAKFASAVANLIAKRAANSKKSNDAKAAAK